ncbi:MAG: GNAT family N-acetyltransferase [Desulfobacterales bacterium]
MQAIFQRLEKNPNYILLGADQQNHLVGSVMGIICEELYGDCRSFKVVEDVIVDKHQRRLEIGSSIYEAAGRVCRQT